MKFVPDRPFADPDVAVRELVEIASTIGPVQNGRIFIELVNAPFLKTAGSPGEYRAGLDRAIVKGWLTRQERHLRVDSPRPARRSLPDRRHSTDELLDWARHANT